MMNFNSSPRIASNAVKEDFELSPWFRGTERTEDDRIESCWHELQQIDAHGCAREECRTECLCGSKTSNVVDLLPKDPFGLEYPCGSTTNDILDILPDDPFAIEYPCGSTTSNILDLLPKDPFGMDVGATFTALADWFEWLDLSLLDSGSDKDQSVKNDYQLIDDLDVYWDKGCMFASPSASTLYFQIEDTTSDLDAYESGYVSAQDVEVSSSYDWITSTSEESTEMFNPCGELPHDALEFVISYLDLRDLLSIEATCKTLFFWVREDHSLWKSIHVGIPLNERLTDGALMSLTARADGRLQCLSLVDCPRITDEGLRHVLLANPMLTKLSVPGCSKISIDGILSSLKAFMSQGISGLRCLRIGELYGLTRKHFEELKQLVAAGSDQQQPGVSRMQRLYPFRHSYFCIDGGFGAIDLEICPRCDNPRILYDCPVEGCKGKPPTSDGCKACILCIRRCSWCGICINNDNEYEETFSLEWVCASCWRDKNVPLVPDQPIFAEDPAYQFRVHL